MLIPAALLSEDDIIELGSGLCSTELLHQITEDKVEIYRREEVERIYYTDNTDLWFALRGAGSSFAIVTEFVVNVFPRPETLPIIMPVNVKSVHDFANIEVNITSYYNR